jgi:hypothetical protein
MILADKCECSANARGQSACASLVDDFHWTWLATALHLLVAESSDHQPSAQQDKNSQKNFFKILFKIRRSIEI